MDKSKVLDVIEAEVKKLTPGYVRYAKLAMLELERNDISAFVLLKNEELRSWWSGELNRVTARFKRAEYARKKYEIKLAAWNKLSAEDRKILNIRKPIAPKVVV